MKMLKCQMTNDCTCKVSHIDNKGFIYCKEHGESRKFSVPCRKIKPLELKQLQDGKPLEKY